MPLKAIHSIRQRDIHLLQIRNRVFHDTQRLDFFLYGCETMQANATLATELDQNRHDRDREGADREDDLQAWGHS